jgi:hypothetical protein
VTGQPRWTAGHHILYWLNGGVTNVTNGVLLCFPHHGVIHNTDWEVRINPTDGLPEFIPPTQWTANANPAETLTTGDGRKRPVGQETNR